MICLPWAKTSPFLTCFLSQTSETFRSRRKLSAIWKNALQAASCQPLIMNFSFFNSYVKYISGTSKQGPGCPHFRHCGPCAHQGPCKILLREKVLLQPYLLFSPALHSLVSQRSPTKEYTSDTIIWTSGPIKAEGGRDWAENNMGFKQLSQSLRLLQTWKKTLSYKLLVLLKQKGSVPPGTFSRIQIP